MVCLNNSGHSVVLTITTDTSLVWSQINFGVVHLWWEQSNLVDFNQTVSWQQVFTKCEGVLYFQDFFSKCIQLSECCKAIFLSWIFTNLEQALLAVFTLLCPPQTHLTNEWTRTFSRVQWCILLAWILLKQKSQGENGPSLKTCALNQTRSNQLSVWKYLFCNLLQSLCVSVWHYKPPLNIRCMCSDRFTLLEMRQGVTLIPYLWQNNFPRSWPSAESAKTQAAVWFSTF